MAGLLAQVCTRGCAGAGRFGPNLTVSRISWPGPLLEGYRFAEDFVFTKAFRKRFQVPEEATSIADWICQKQHHDWIEAFLVQRQELAV